jgi:hypothetical protein
VYKGFILSQSLKDPRILNQLEKIYVQVEYHPESKPKFWEDYKVKIKDSDLKEVAGRLADQIKFGWYSHFWNESQLVVVLPKKIFIIPRGKSQSKELSACKEYAMKHGVEERYLEFWIQEEDVPRH